MFCSVWFILNPKDWNFQRAMISICMSLGWEFMTEKFSTSLLTGFFFFFFVRRRLINAICFVKEVVRDGNSSKSHKLQGWRLLFQVGWEKEEMPPVCLETDLLKSKVQRVLVSFKQKQAEKRNRNVNKNMIWNKWRSSATGLGGFFFCSLSGNSKQK